jgi:hypothetical protein
MTAPLLDRDYHVLRFDRAAEAAGFVAALSRFLNSPVGSTYVDHTDSLEVWSCAPTALMPDIVELFLSDTALDAAATVFSPVRVAGVRRGETLSTACVLVIGGDQVPSWGFTDAERFLANQ